MLTELPFTPDLITADLPTKLLPSNVLCYEQIPSTMDVARVHGQVGMPEGLLVLAEEQTAGRGRMGRSWVAPPGSALLLSLLLRPSWMLAANAFSLTMLAAVSLCEAIEDVTTLHPVLKWPNDVLLPLANSQQYGKTSGILIELELQHGQVAWAVIGCGINVHSYPPSSPGQLFPAISLDAAWVQEVERLALLRALLQRFDAGYAALQAGEQAGLFEAWRRRLVTIGQRVRVDTPAGLVEGLAENVLPNGALLVRQVDGTVRTITAGDVAAQ